mmetsp:Transcript_30411/g.98234  ORF Transcript_30411/g.98234 Transcript_30411/m.98234 type:complete len:201 (-) Transcript_30411:474-1076(-)
MLVRAGQIATLHRARGNQRSRARRRVDRAGQRKLERSGARRRGRWGRSGREDGDSRMQRWDRRRVLQRIAAREQAHDRRPRGCRRPAERRNWSRGAGRSPSRSSPTNHPRALRPGHRRPASVSSERVGCSCWRAPRARMGGRAGRWMPGRRGRRRSPAGRGSAPRPGCCSPSRCAARARREMRLHRPNLQMTGCATRLRA